MATTTKFKKRGPNLGGKRDHPPVDNCSPAEWAWRTRSPVYRKKIKRAVEQTNAYLALTKGPASRGVTGTQRDFCHFCLDEIKERERGARRPREQADTSNAPTKAVEALK